MDRSMTMIQIASQERYAAGDAMFQLGETYLIMEKDADALKHFQKLLAEHPNSPHVREAMLRTGLIYNRQGNQQKALETFKSIVTKYPTHDTGQALALAGLFCLI